MLRFACPHCGCSLKARENMRGHTLPCPNCAKKVSVPGATDASDAGQDVYPLAGESQDVSSTLITCSACGHSIAKTAAACPRCGARNEWVHPELQRFLNSARSVELGASWQWAHNQTAVWGTASPDVEERGGAKGISVGMTLFGVGVLLLFLGPIGWAIAGLLIPIGLFLALAGSLLCKRSDYVVKIPTFRVDFAGPSPRWESNDDEFWKPLRQLLRQAPFDASATMACPHCSRPIQNDPALAGKTASCPYCGQLRQVPAVPIAEPIVEADSQAVIVTRARTSTVRRSKAGVVLGITAGSFLAMLFIGSLFLHVSNSRPRTVEELERWREREVEKAVRPLFRLADNLPEDSSEAYWLREGAKAFLVNDIETYAGVVRVCSRDVRSHFAAVEVQVTEIDSKYRTWKSELGIQAQSTLGQGPTAPDIDRAKTDTDAAERVSVQHQKGGTGKTLADWLAEGHAALEARDNEGALKAFSEAIKSDPQSAAAYNCRGVAHLRLNKLKPALTDFTKAIQLKPDEAKAYGNRALVYSDQNKFREAILDLTKAIELESQSAHWHRERGYVFYLMDDEAHANADFDAAKQLENLESQRQ